MCTCHELMILLNRLDFPWQITQNSLLSFTLYEQIQYLSDCHTFDFGANIAVKNILQVYVTRTTICHAISPQKMRTSHTPNKNLGVPDKNGGARICEARARQFRFRPSKLRTDQYTSYLIHGIKARLLQS